jgi:hypothetical protein
VQLVNERDALDATRKSVAVDYRLQIQAIDKRVLALAEAMSRGEKA